MVVMWFGDVDKYEGIDDGFDDRAGEDVDDVGVDDNEGGLILIGVNNKAGGGGGAYLIFVIFFTRAKFLENKIYTVNCQFTQ